MSPSSALVVTDTIVRLLNGWHGHRATILWRRENMYRKVKSAFLFATCLLAAQTALGQTVSNGVTPGQFVIEPPTLQNLGFEWYIDGDANRNATVSIFYRKTSDTSGAWK